jgi:hypothetical protein
LDRSVVEKGRAWAAWQALPRFDFAPLRHFDLRDLRSISFTRRAIDFPL